MESSSKTEAESVSSGDSRVIDKKAAGEGEENSGNKKGTVSCRCSDRYICTCTVSG